MVLIGCGASKRTERSRVRDLYTGALFRKALAYAETLAADGDIFVVSGFYNTPLRLDAEILPYERKLDDMPKPYREGWGRLNAAMICENYHVARFATEVVILAGGEYARCLRLGFACRPGIIVREPMAGLMIGERLSWLNRHTTKLGELR